MDPRTLSQWHTGGTRTPVEREQGGPTSGVGRRGVARFVPQRARGQALVGLRSATFRGFRRSAPAGLVPWHAVARGHGMSCGRAR